MVLLFSLASAVSFAENIAATSVDRAWGLLLGDELITSASLPENIGKLDLNSLPQTGRRFGTWLYLKQLEHSNDTLVFTYQVVNVPKANTKINTPTFEVTDNKGNVIKVAQTEISIGPLLSSKDNEILKLKSDHAPIYLPTDEFEQRLKTAVIVAAFVSVILVIWHFGWKPRNRQPFAQAVHELSRLRWKRSKDKNQPARILHAAFNSSAGTIVVHKELAQLFEMSPWLASLETDIEQFYLTSAGHFFTKEAGQEPALAEIVKLAKACRSKEKLA